MLRIGIECESIEDSQTWGVGRIINQLLENISKRPELANEFKFFLYFKSNIPDYKYLDNSIFVKKIVAVPILPVSFSLYYYLFLPIKTFFDRLDLVFFPNYMLPILFFGKSVVMLTEDIYYEYTSGKLPLRYRLAYRIFGSWAAKHATKLIAMSESSKQELIKIFKVSASRVVVNHLGVNLPGGKKPSVESKKFSVPFILYVGQAFPRRHLQETILAFKKIAPKFRGLNLIAVGKDKYYPPLVKELVIKVNQSLGKQRIFHFDYVTEDDLSYLYSHCQCLIYISSKEAFGLPPIEGLSRGAVPIVSDQPVNREIFGDAAFFVIKPNSVEDIAHTIEFALSDHQKRNEIKTQADAIAGKYSWRNFTDNFLKIIKDVK